jgi:hypothetical protein
MVRRGAVLLTALLMLASVGLAAPEAADASYGPTVKVTPAWVEPGGLMAVVGTGFAALQQSSVAVCGAGATEGSAGCDLANQVTLLTDSFGGLRVWVRVGLPPVPCPCDVVVDSGDNEVVEPILIIGARSAPTRAPTPVSAPTLKVTDAHLSGSGPFTAWLGGPAQRTLVFTLHDDGPGPSPSAPVTLRLRSPLGGDTTVNAPPTGALNQGQSRTFRVPVDLGPLAVGQFDLQGQIESFGNPTDFKAGSLAMPWMLLVALLLVLQSVLLFIRNRVRARLHSPEVHGPVHHPAAGDHQMTAASAQLAHCTTQIEQAVAVASSGGEPGLEFVATANRMIVRQPILATATELLETRQALLETASAAGRADLLVLTAPLERASDRLLKGFRNVNRLVVSRPEGIMAARLLGFDPVPDRADRPDRPDEVCLIEEIHELTSPLELLAVHVTQLARQLGGAAPEEQIEKLLDAAWEVHHRAQAFTASALEAGDKGWDGAEALAGLSNPDGIGMLRQTAEILASLPGQGPDIPAVMAEMAGLVNGWQRLGVDRALVAQIHDDLNTAEAELTRLSEVASSLSPAGGS